MKTPLLAIARWALLIWGAFSLVAVIAFAAFIAFEFCFVNRDKVESASVPDVRFVLNWCHLGDQRIEKVVHSQVSARSFTGDHVDAYAIRISHVEPAELAGKPDHFGGRWYRGDQLPKVVDDAVTFVGGWLHYVPWFPSEAELRSSEFYVYPWSIYCHGITPTAAELIFIRPSDRMVFYFGGKS